MAIVQCKGASLFGTFLVRIGAGFDPHDQRVVVDRISPVIGKASLYSSLVLVWRALIAPATCKLGAARSGDQPKEPAVSAKGQVAARLGAERLRLGAVGRRVVDRNPFSCSDELFSALR